ncbi:heme biosynthesis protein HemY [Allofrancisella guangzhouensis]|uniref:Membrane protein n=1 Tax=Allofrancisella guangzhouensis TaxID=594679 RepID=A0A0A8E3X1_9GAMM|nr:hypothetical protein [Allofrancisella guangzhouensis]AJC48688.1 membrane protein [Allofrancisella guangzhouensis]MBK2027917.1 heme biosynthesis protein HemY [Allofrancisella guangzhouensis]MBK2043968.1 heme biosynthesis protein HemY [Allofrancisella guangzhouensis]MBK2046371.1 heme biosynthesis protein HemY [Allofrancisella guangzhouensis]
MMKIFKLIFVVAAATVIGIWATKYHGFIMLVLADKSIKINLVAFVFMLVIIIFLTVFGYRFFRLLLSLPYLIFSWFIGLFLVNKREKFVDLMADILLEHNELISKTGLSKLIKFTPKYLQDYVVFKKISILIENKDIKALELAIKQLDNHTFVYKFFEAYLQYLMNKVSDAQISVKALLTERNSKFLPNIVNLAAKVTLANSDNNFALFILEKYNPYLETKNEEALIVLVLKEAKNVSQLTNVYNKCDATATLNRIYVEQLLKFNDTSTAQKFMKKQLGNLEIDSKMLYMYVNAFNIEIFKLYSKVCNEANKNYDSMLTLLSLAMMKSDIQSFKMVYQYIETNIKAFLPQYELEKYQHILCRFYIKNGSVAGIDLSEARLVYGKY